MKDYNNVTKLIGETLIILQKLEALLKASLIIEFKASADAKLQKLLEEDKQTLGMLLKVMKTKIELSEDFDKTLSDLLYLRNVFIHKLFLQDWFSLHNQQGLNNVDKFLNEILSKAATSIRIFIAFCITGSTEISEKNKILFDKIIKRIVLTAPKFNPGEFEKYLEKFEKELDKKYVKRLTGK